MPHSIRQRIQAANNTITQIAEAIGGSHDDNGMINYCDGVALEVRCIAAVDDQDRMYVTVSTVTGATVGFENHIPMVLDDRDGEDVTHLLVNDEGLVDADWFIPQIIAILENIPVDDFEDDI